MSVKISELPVLDSLADNDVLAGVDTSANTTSKVTLGSLKQYIDTNTQYTAGTNIDITNNVVSAPNVYNKTETDNLLNAKENISNKVTTLSSSSTNTQYPSAKIVYDELNDLETNLTNDINDLNDEINNQINNKIQELEEELESVSTIFNAFPTESEEGESFTLDDTAEVKFKKLDLKGNTSQTSYSGKNLLGVSNGSKTSNGITLTITNNNILTYSGTATGTYARFDSENHTLPAGTYTFSIDKATTGNERVVLYYTLADNSVGTFQISTNNTSTTNTLSSSITQWYVGINNITSGTSYSGTFKLQLESGSTKTDYEPYVGGTASPNPDFPQLVNVVSGDNEIVVNGKNFYKVDNTPQTTKNGITYSIENGTITLNGTATASTDIDLSTTYLLNANTYTISTNVISGSYTGVVGKYVRKKVGSGYSIILDGSGIASTRTVTTSESTDMAYGALYVANGATFSNYKVNIQLEKGSSASEYEPYQGDTYNIDLPVENMLDTQYFQQGSINTSGVDVSANTNARGSNYIPVQPNTSYTISANTQLYDLRLSEYTSDKTHIKRNSKNNTTSLTITTSSTTYFVRWSLNYNNSTPTTQAIIDSLNLQLEKGSKPNSYTPFGTTPIEMCSSPDGTLRDYFLHDKTTDYWYKYWVIGKAVLNGTENNISGWSSFTNKLGIKISDVLNLINISSSATDNVLISNYFEKATSQNILYGNDIEGIATTGGNIYIKIDKTTASTSTEFKTWLSSHNTDVYYVLATPTTTQITYQPLIDQLNALELALSKNGQTNISQVNNDLGFIIYAEAIKSLENVLDRLALVEE